MYQLKFTLKQHTPIIHFQHDQVGATLRATEVKPKLDRFILMKLGREADNTLTDNDAIYKKGKEVANSNGWLIDKDKGALDYKMRVELPEFNQSLLEIKRNIKIINDAVENSTFYKGDILIIFTVANKLLSDKIKNSLDEFFVVTNFGKRQNKGFGCFFKKELNFDSDIKPLLKSYTWYLLDENHTTENLLRFDTNRFRNNYQFYLLISDKWRKIKSGFNPGGTYIKSSVFKYLCNQGLRWDKRWIKKELSPLIRPNHLKSNNAHGRFNEPNDCGGRNYNCNNTPDYQGWRDNSNFNAQNGNSYRFGRAMLGLAEHYEFKNSNGQITYQVQVKSDDVERYKAPITFKVFDYKIFAIAENQLLYDKTFYFKTKVKQEGRNDEYKEFKDAHNNHKTLHTPSSSEWDLISFLDKFFPCVKFIKQ